MAAGTGMPPQWLHYWLPGGKGGTEIAWDSPGDFERCVHLIQAKVTEHGRPPLADNTIKGLCATLHRMATGATPGHAIGDKA